MNPQMWPVAALEEKDAEIARLKLAIIDLADAAWRIHWKKYDDKDLALVERAQEAPSLLTTK
jgi:hypothetical protein